MSSHLRSSFSYWPYQRTRRDLDEVDISTVNDLIFAEPKFGILKDWHIRVV